MSDSSQSNDDDIMNEIIQGMNISPNHALHLAKETVETQMEKDSKVIYLESLDLQDMKFLIKYNYSPLEELHLQRNMLCNIDILNAQLNLRVLDASDNYLEEVNLKIPKLQTLNLQNNYLKKFPVLQNMNNLRYLNLNSNQLVDFKEV